jgi:hypothetical protein
MIDQLCWEMACLAVTLRRIVRFAFSTRRSSLKRLSFLSITSYFLMLIRTPVTLPASSARNSLGLSRVVFDHIQQSSANRLPNLLFVGCGGDF